MADWKQSSAKETSRLKQTVGNIFGLGGPKVGLLADEDSGERSVETSRFFTEDVLKMIGCEVPRTQRLRALKELHELVYMKRLEKHAVEAIWSTVRDLIDPHQPSDVRHQAFKFLSALIQGQYDYLGVLQGHFFQVIKSHRIEEDLLDRLDILQVLTQGGKNVQYIDEDIGSLMAEWMPAVMEDAKVESRKLFVTILVNLVHFNAVYLETHHVQQLVQTCGRYLAANTDTEIIELILDFLNSLVCFGCLSAGVLEHFVLSLCWILNCERFCTRSWDVMRKLLGTHLGHNTLVTLQAIVTERKGNPSEVLVVRAAIFYISMALWGPNRISKLGSCFSPFLPTLMEGVLTYQTIVVYEVSLSLLRLTKKHGTDLGPGEWEEIVNILAVIDKHVRREVGSQVGSTLKNTVDEIFNVIEMLHENGCLIGVDSKFYLLVEQSSQFRTINSIVSLIRFKSKGLSPDEPQWISSFNQLLTTFYSGERRTEVRLQVLEVLKRKLEKYLVFYEDMLLHDVVVPTLNSVSSDPDPSVRKVAVEIMVQVAENCSPSWCHHLINCIYQVTSHCIHADKAAMEADRHKPGGIPKYQDSKFALFGLANLFKLKLGRLPPGVAVTIFDMLVRHLIEHYHSGYHSDASSLDHLVIFEIILHLRANEDGHIGFGDGERSIDCSPFVLCRDPPQVQSSSTLAHVRKMSDTRRWGPVDPVVLDYREAYGAIILCLQQEPQWEVLQSVLMDLPQWLGQLNLLTLTGIHLDTLCCNLCALLSNPNALLQRIHSKPRGSFTDELRSLVFPVLFALCPYAEGLERQSQEKLVYTFQQGLISHKARLCVNSLTICMLEIQPTMGRQVAAILMKLNQAAASPSMAVPVLEFLHGLCSLPKLCKAFVENQYLLVFAILVPYTNAYKYSKSVVCLAHRVLALWFIRSRMQYRRTIAQFILKKLAEHGGLLDEQSLAPPTSAEGHTPGDEKDANSIFHFEMMQVCMDLLARYTYSIVSSQPKRSPLSEFLISDGPSKTWLVKNYLVTVTTSGAGGSGGVCQRCVLVRAGLLGTRSVDKNPPVEKEDHPQLCSCWNRGWAEVNIRRPTGCVSWLMRVQNQLDMLSSLDPLLTSHLWRDIGIAGMSSSDLVSESSSLPFQHPSSTISRRSSCKSESPDEENCDEDPVQSESTHPDSSYGDVSDPEVLEAVGEGDDLTLYKNTVSSSSGHVPSNPITVSVVRFDRRHRPSANSELCEFFPPLLSYEGDTRSPSLHSDSTLLNEQQQLTILATMSEGTRSHSESIPQESGESEGEFALEVPFDEQQHEEAAMTDREQQHEEAAMTDREQQHEEAAMTDREQQHEEAAMTDREQQHEEAAMKDREQQHEEAAMKDREQQHEEAAMMDREQQHEEAAMTDREQGKLNSVEQHPIVEQLPMNIEQPALNVEQSIPNVNQSTPGVEQPPSKADVLPLGSTRRIAQDISGAGEGMRKDLFPAKNLPLVERSNGQRDEGTVGGNNFQGGKLGLQHHIESELKNAFESSQRGGSGYSAQDRELLNNPSFVFLELYYSSSSGEIGETPPILIPNDEAAERAIKVLDHIPPYEVHKIGVVYVAPEQTAEQSILGNMIGSTRYLSFLTHLGTRVQLSDCNPDLIYLGGLDKNGADGETAILWHDEITQVVFHVATLMPNSDTDGSHSNKKLHIGNDFVTIVYNNSKLPYTFGTIKGQFNFFEVIIDPLPYDCNRVYIQAKKGHEDMIDCHPTIVSDKWLPLYVRLLALHANMARIACEATGSNWLERLHQINRLKNKYSTQTSLTNALSDFTAFTS